MPSDASFYDTCANGIFILSIFGYFANAGSSHSRSFSASNGLRLEMKASALGLTDSIGFEAGIAGKVCGSFLFTGFFGTGGGFGNDLGGSGGSLGTNPATLPVGLATLGGSLAFSFFGSGAFFAGFSFLGGGGGFSSFLGGGGGGGGRISFLGGGGGASF